MSKQLLSAALIAGLGLAFVPGANAADGTLTIEGLVLSSTCDVVAGTSNAVTLPTVQTTDFSSGVAGETTFDVKMTNCPTGSDIDPLVVSVFFDGTNVDGTTGYLKDTTTANGVAIELTDGGSNPIDLRNTTAASQSTKTATVDSTTGEATLTYAARYRETSAGSAAAGRVSTTVDYTINYL
ncbi:fimbrial protein [Frateuria hangzhouensis]|uniref:fimbrial protein n=1 Tax=Frateuria hangzhouensis TaxID=2995589 RepID=UPI002260C8F7|nr:fimbrial protein [Frateuria sp. STR12]MCX7512610.1 fimbrial protein [Frateuria sp. STR12]